jgi:hypothetical protein
MADLASVATAHERAITGITHYNAAHAWGRWEKYCTSIGCKEFTSTDLNNRNKFLSSGLLARLSEKEDSQHQGMRHWLREQSDVPSHMWYRPSGQRADQTPLKTMTTTLACFYQDSSTLSKTKTQKKSKKKPFHSQSLTN